MTSPHIPKVAIIAIAKDEAPYLAEWIAHHTYFGVERFYIGINRTIDASLEVLNYFRDLIVVEDVTFFDQAVGALMNVGMQRLAYAYFANKIHQDITHIFFLDVDEFWYSKGFAQSLPDFCRSHTFDMASFQWIQQGGGNRFELPFKNKTGEINPHLKSIITTDTVKDITQFRAHVPLPTEQAAKTLRYVDADGTRIPDGFPQLRPHGYKKPKNAFILHRYIRSEAEYIADLLHPIDEHTHPIKRNRSGYYEQTTIPKELNFDIPDDYYDHLGEVLSQGDLEMLINNAQDEHLQTTRQLLDVDDRVLVTHCKLYAKSLRGTGQYANFCSRLLNGSLSAEALRDCALATESLDISLAFELMKKAGALKPSGLFIQNKLDAYSVLAKEANA